MWVCPGLDISNLLHPLLLASEEALGPSELSGLKLDPELSDTVLDGGAVSSALAATKLTTEAGETNPHAVPLLSPERALRLLELECLVGAAAALGDALDALAVVVKGDKVGGGLGLDGLSEQTICTLEHSADLSGAANALAMGVASVAHALSVSGAADDRVQARLAGEGLAGGELDLELANASTDAANKGNPLGSANSLSLLAAGAEAGAASSLSPLATGTAAWPGDLADGELGAEAAHGAAATAGTASNNALVAADELLLLA